MRALPALGLALILAACRPDGEVLTPHRLFAMATWVDVSLPPAALEREPDLIADIEAMLRQIEGDYYAFGDGELAAMNRSLTDSGRFDATPELAGLVAQARSIARATRGAFDPGVGALVELWGFAGSDVPTGSPSDEAIAATLAAFASIDALSVTGTRVEAPDTANAFLIDLGGIAKGFAVDRIVAMLESRGVATALVNAGGDLRVVGNRPDRPWRIGIAHPRSDGLLGTLELESGEAAFSSGDYERFFDDDGVRRHHILDPRTGYPVAHTQAVTVIATDGALADAAATALFVAGPDEWRSMGRALGIDAVLRVDASGRIDMTARMRDRFQRDPEVSSDIIAAAD